jgi:hypothetical protein
MLSRIPALVSALLVIGGCTTLRETTITDANPAPCPAAFALLEAGRMVEFAGGGESFNNVGFTAEIEDVRSLCVYLPDGGPILSNIEVDISYGRGPAADQRRKTYPLFVAVTRKNLAVIEKQVFSTDVTFPRGSDRIFKTETFREVRIPRAAESVAGGNFEILVGFELTPEQIEFNRAGKRFLIDSGS